MKIIKTPPKTPQCNAYAERFVREVRETLDLMIPLGERHFRHILKTIEYHHNQERPHQGIGNVIPVAFDYPAQPVPVEEVRRRSSLGGLFSHYYFEKKSA